MKFKCYGLDRTSAKKRLAHVSVSGKGRIILTAGAVALIKKVLPKGGAEFMFGNDEAYPDDWYIIAPEPGCEPFPLNADRRGHAYLANRVLADRLFALAPTPGASLIRIPIKVAKDGHMLSLETKKIKVIK